MIPALRTNRNIHTQYKQNYEASDLTNTHHEEEHSENGPGRSEGHGTAEDAENADRSEHNRFPAEPEV